MRIKGSILLVLLVMLLFASVALLQLNEDNYSAHLIDRHVEDLSAARKALHEAFDKLSISVIPQECYSDTPVCQIKISGIVVNYALREYRQEEQKSSYLHYTLHDQVNLASVELRGVVEMPSNLVVSWVYA